MRNRLLPALLALTPFACGGDDTPATTSPASSSSSESSSSSTVAPESSSGDAEESSSGPVDPSTSSESTAVDSSSSSEDGGGQQCGNAIIEGSEDCDCGEFLCTPASLDNKICSDVPSSPVLTGGTLGCNMASCKFDTTLCSWCGDEFIGDFEDCEPEEEVTVDCNQLGEGSAGSVVCGEACTWDVSACTDCGTRFEFQGGGGCPYGFTVTKLDPDASGSSWQCGDPNNYAQGPGTDVDGVYATNLVGEYNAHEISALTSPVIELDTCAAKGLELELVHWHNFEGGDDNSDGGIVQVSTDGTTWTTIAPSSGSMYSVTPIDATYAPVQGVNGFSGEADEEEWLSSVFDLADYSEEDQIQVRLVIGSDENVQYGGWYIDTLEVRGIEE
jgi:hypothetical protein